MEKGTISYELTFDHGFSKRGMRITIGREPLRTGTRP